MGMENNTHHSDELGLHSTCTHIGEVKDEQFKGAVSPLYMSSSYEYENVDVKRYPRYFNTPNQEFLSKKLAALEKTESALIFGSGMAAISTTLMALLRAGDHAVFQQSLYGGTYNFATTQLNRCGMQYNFTTGTTLAEFQAVVRPETKLIYLETPSNPLLAITPLKEIADWAKSKGITTVIDNTFASPVNQNPVELGIDIVMHSATKYLGGHSDLCAGAVMASEDWIKQIWQSAICFGGSLSDYSVWMLERSIKTLGVRVQRQNQLAGQLAEWLRKQSEVKRVYYPGLEDHPGHALAKSQMKGFGGMISFDLRDGIQAEKVLESTRLIKPSMSLAGVESTALLPAKTSHSLMEKEERLRQGISDQLIRFSVGIEEVEDLQKDWKRAFEAGY